MAYTALQMHDASAPNLNSCMLPMSPPKRTFATRHASLIPIAHTLVHAVAIILTHSLNSPAQDLDGLNNFITTHCTSCHNKTDPQAGLDLSTFTWSVPSTEILNTAIRLYDRVDKKEMPPETETQPKESHRTEFLSTLKKQLISLEKQILSPSQLPFSEWNNPSRTVLRRLNRIEYENTIRDLLNVQVNVKDILPPDSSSQGFDTVAESLRFSQLQMEKYLEAADVALTAATELSQPPEKFFKRLSLKDEKFIQENLATPDGTQKDPNSKDKHRVLFRELPDAIVMFSTGYPPGDFRSFSAPATGNYRIRASAYAYQTQGQPATLRIYTHRFREKRLLGFFEMPPEPREIEFIAHLEKNHLIQVLPYGVGVDPDGKDIWNIGATEFKGSGLALQWIEIEGPLGNWPPQSVETLYPNVPLKEIPKNKRRWRPQGTLGFELAPNSDVPINDTSTPDTLATETKRVVSHFAQRAFRRPLEPEEDAPFVQLALDALNDGATFEQSTNLAFRAILTAPQFLFFDESDGQLSDFALANRLAYFLWSSPPDQVLLELAQSGSLHDPTHLHQQTERLLNHPKAANFVKNFTGQWLDLRKINATSPDKQLYPEFDEMLEDSMVKESEAFFTELLAKNEPITSVIHSDFLMINRTMAKHYGIEGVSSERFERIPLPPGSPRGGVMTQAAILKVTANGTVTSPVVRGAWVLKQILGTPPAAPPPNVGSVEPDTRGASTIRELLDKHRNSPTCASCHRDIDPPGFALEAFDVIGGYRENYRSLEQGTKPTWKLNGRDIWQFKVGPLVDTTGTTRDGISFSNIQELKQILLRNPSQITRTLTEKLLIYASGSKIRFSDRDAINTLVQDVQAQGGGLRSLVHAVVQSQLFQQK
jgi:Protein of unknown function (DUF1592)/Protein of unknown function (DUF1588)/Protein of unknown function (DUF1587)/Protein of unknown function (DUF1585)/Protein of unknown function (DUF1595)